MGVSSFFHLLAFLSSSIFEKGTASSSQSRNGVEQFPREFNDASCLVFAHEAFHSDLVGRLEALRTQKFIKEVLNLVVIGLTALLNVHHQFKIFEFLRNNLIDILQIMDLKTDTYVTVSNDRSYNHPRELA